MPLQPHLSPTMPPVGLRVDRDRVARVTRVALLGAALCLGPLAHAQVATPLPAGTPVEGFIEVRHERLLGSDLVMRIPLPPGRWTLRHKQERISTGTRATGLDLFLDQVAGSRIASLLYLGVYPNLSVPWFGGPRCAGDLLRKDRGTSIDGYCFSLRTSTFASNPTDPAQIRVREAWREAGIGRAEVSLAMGGFFEKRGGFTIYLDHHVTPDALSSSRSIFQGRDTRERFAAAWQRGMASGQLVPLSRWYEDYALTLALASGIGEPAAPPPALGELPPLLQAAADAISAAIPGGVPVANPAPSEAASRPAP